MTARDDAFTSAALHEALFYHPFVTKIVYKPRTRSTNILARECASRGAPEGLLVIADEQSAGRGRMGRRWWAPARSALLTSLLFRPAPLQDLSSGPGYAAQQLTALCALAAADAIANLTTLTVDLKWPNDLLVRDRKLAGLLAESIFSGDRLDAIIVGLGINVNADFDNAPPFIAAATSLKLQMGHDVNRLALLVAYLDRVALRYDQLKAGVSPFDEWRACLVTLGQHITASFGGFVQIGGASEPAQLSGIAESVDASGALLLRTSDGVVHRLLAADVSVKEHSPI